MEVLKLSGRMQALADAPFVTPRTCCAFERRPTSSLRLAGGRRLHGPHIFFFFLGAALLLAVNLHLDSAFRDGYLLGSVGETVFPGG